MAGMKKLFSGRRFLLPIFCIYLMSPSGHANDTNELDFFNDEIPVVLSATRLAQPQTEAPASITIIDRELIKLSGAIRQ